MANKKTSKRPKVNKQQQIFAEEMAKNEPVSQTEAYRRAYPKASATTARINASKLLTNTNIQEQIKKNKEFALASANITKEDSLGRLAMFAFADFDMLVNESGTIDWKKAKETGAFKVVKKFKEIRKPTGEVVREVELHDPIRALSEIADYAGWKQKPRENDDEISKLKILIERRAEQKGVPYKAELENYLELFGDEIRPEIKDDLASDLITHLTRYLKKE